MIDPSQQGAPPAGMQEQQAPPPPVQYDTDPEPKMLNAISELADKAGSADGSSDAHEFAQAANSLASAIAALAKAGELHQAAMAAAEQAAAGGQTSTAPPAPGAGA